MTLTHEEHGKITARIEALRERYDTWRIEAMKLRNLDDALVACMVRDLEGLRDGDARECASSLTAHIKLTRQKEFVECESRRLELERQLLIADILTLRGLL